MSRVGNPVSKITRSIGSTASRPVVEAHYASLAPKYAELLRNRRPRVLENNQSDAHSHARHLMTQHVPAPHQPNLVKLPSSASNASVERRTPVPILFNPQTAAQRQTSAPARDFAATPEVHFIAKNPKNPDPSIAGIEHLDVDEIALKAAASS